MLCPQLSLGTKRILRGKQALADNAGSPSHTQAYSGSPQSPQKQGQHDFLGRLQQESDSHTSTGASSSPGYSTAESPVARRAVKTSGGGVSSGKGSSGGWTSDEYTYKPRITSKAAAKKGRSFEEMSEGDRLRREVRLVSRLMSGGVLNVCTVTLHAAYDGVLSMADAYLLTFAQTCTDSMRPIERRSR